VLFRWLAAIDGAELCGSVVWLLRFDSQFELFVLVSRGDTAGIGRGTLPGGFAAFGALTVPVLVS
jgi:hypothetical protein